MKILELSDEVYENLTNFVVDPFDDTPDSVINRLININHKAKSRWSPLEDSLSDELSQNNEDELHEKVI